MSGARPPGARTSARSRGATSRTRAPGSGDPARSPGARAAITLHRTIHGHRIAYRQAGTGPLVVLIHGITSDATTWSRVMPYLARRFTVLAPDMMGHGDSAKPRGDYSLGAHASSIRDLMASLGHRRATFVGHSLGGGVAMQIAYQFPELCERLVLVDSGGFGREVSPLLRAAALPGSEFVLPLLAASRLNRAGQLAADLLSKLGLRMATDISEMARGHATLSDAGARAAFVHTLRSVVEPSGQRIGASDRLYLARHLPLMLVWGERDTIIPVSHAYDGHERLPGSRLEIFQRSGHFPQLDEPERFIDLLADFVETTEPAAIDLALWRELLEAGAG
jgi:pimeloyl-ACP methyl ester carboxylesterase